MSVNSLQFTNFNSFMSIHALQVIHDNSFMRIHSCQFIRFNFTLIPAWQFLHFNSFISIHSWQFIRVNSCVSSQSFRVTLFNWLMSIHGFHAFHSSRLSNSTWIPIKSHPIVTESFPMWNRPFRALPWLSLHCMLFFSCSTQCSVPPTAVSCS